MASSTGSIRNDGHTGDSRTFPSRSEYRHARISRGAEGPAPSSHQGGFTLRHEDHVQGPRRHDLTPRGPFLKSGSEEFQSDVVRVTAREPRAVAGIDDSAIFDTEFRQPEFPRLKLISASTGEGQMVQTNSTLIERTRVRWIGEFVKPDERLTFDKPDSSSKRAGVFVPLKRHVEESFVPPDTAVEITDCQRHLCDGRQVGHRSLLVRGMNRCRRSFWPPNAPERHRSTPRHPGRPSGAGTKCHCRDHTNP